MSVRTNPEEVREIMPTDLTDPQIDPYIVSANAIVTANVTCGLSSAILKEIERWLSAHLIATTKERQTKSEKLGDAEVVYFNVMGEGLKATSYGQTALLLDTCGGLANMGKKAISIKAITSFD